MTSVLSGGSTAAGPVAAQAGAAAASVLAAVAREAGDGAVAAQAEALCTRLQRLAAQDAAALAEARAAMPGPDQVPAASDGRRDFALGRALDRAAMVPLEIAEACADLVSLARGFSGRAEPLSVADVEAAALLATGAARAAAHLVEINLAVGLDDERAVRARAAAASRTEV